MSPSATASTASRFDAGNRKQAQIPAGAEVLGIAGTAPGLVMAVGDTHVVVLPGVPSELRRLWTMAPDASLARAGSSPGPSRGGDG